MTDAMAGSAGAGGGSDAVIRLAPGHAISAQGVHEKLAALDTLSVPLVLSAVKKSLPGVGYEIVVGRERFRSSRCFDMYLEAQAKKDWDEADRLFLDELKQDRAEYGRLLGEEASARAFSAWLCKTALSLDYAYRWIDLPEVGSCVGGTFESRIEADGKRRGFKALTIDSELVYGERKIRMRVPMDNTIRGCIWCVRYTALPRRIKEKDERIGDPKSAEHAAEAEIRVPDGTPIPSKTDFVVLKGARIDKDTTKALEARYRITWNGG